MTNYAWEYLDKIPSVKHFIESIVDDLLSKRNLIVLLPPGIPTEYVWGLVTVRLYERGLVLYHSAACDITNVSESTLLVARTLLNTNDQIFNSLKELLDSPGIPDVICLKNLSDVKSDKERKIWCDHIARWAEDTLNLETRKTTVFCVVESALSILNELPDLRTPNLSIRWWWNLCSAYELRIMIRDYYNQDCSSYIWNECVISGLAAGDIALAAFLLPLSIKSHEDIVIALRSYGEMLTIDDSNISILERTELLSNKSSIQPSDDIMTDWAKGYITSSVEYGIGAHPSLYALADDSSTVDLLIWRGQLPILFPILNKIRYWCASTLVSNYGVGWYTSRPPVDKRDYSRLQKNPLDAEIGYMYDYMFNNGLNMQSPKLKNMLGQAHFVRTSIAHYKSVTYDDFARIQSYI